MHGDDGRRTLRVRLFTSTRKWLVNIYERIRFQRNVRRFGRRFRVEQLFIDFNFYNVSRLLRWIIRLFPTPTEVVWAGFSAAFVCLFVCLYVCLFFHTVFHKPVHLGSTHLTQTCSTRNPENPFILGSTGQRSVSEGTKNSAGNWKARRL